ncbi:unnamed protein product [Paramecium sonneborni]|uniref:Uncharacterized protein n=1 Tax=Paramecium sonneborni TaxID=65129 RepID=A0A8S1RT48_9CILI|nr:unnamed protein product [Paramecium sonneborni]
MFQNREKFVDFLNESVKIYYQKILLYCLTSIIQCQKSQLTKVKVKMVIIEEQITIYLKLDLVNLNIDRQLHFQIIDCLIHLENMKRFLPLFCYDQAFLLLIQLLLGV